MPTFIKDKSRWQKLWENIKILWRYYRGWKWLIFISLSLALILSTYLVILAKTTSVNTLQEALKSETLIYSVHDEQVGKLNGQKGNYVSIDAIADPMIQTVINTEDRRFYDHNGYDLRGMARAAVRLVINRDTSGGGGSTLTQQLAKNAFLTQDQTMQRKFKELFLALEIEKTYDKDQILEMYLNHSYFGNGVWGVEDASQKYFGHSASSLDWNESAVLTGMLKGPSIFNPIDDYEAAIDRRNVVLESLGEQGVLAMDDVSYLQQMGITLYDNYFAEDNYTYPYYFDAVINEATEVADIPEDDLLAKGYRIYTHLNPSYQNAIDNSYQNDWMFPDSGEEEPAVQSASIVLDSETGGVAAVYGGRGEYTYRGFNRATDMRRSPGSTIKPLAVYVPALEAGYQMHSTLPDVVQGYGSNDYTPENYDRQTEPSGEVETWYAIAQSKNTTAVYLMDQLGIDKAVQKLKQFGIPVLNEDKSLTLALGAFSKGVTVQELAGAYQAFANEGVRHETAFIRRIEDPEGKVVYNNERPNRHMVMTKNVAADMTSMMLDTFGGYGTSFGSGPDYGQIAGKSGSTEVGDGNMETRDRWLVGYTPDFVIATWVGLDELGGESLDNLMPQGMGQLFNQQTTQLMGASPQTPFTVTNASQTSLETNLVTDSTWEEQTGERLDQAINWLNENGGQLWQEVEQGAQQLWYQGRQWMNQWDLPF
ncbi:PBP1A family penicillin-binding protein [Aerococcaceae bacterium DSM 111020]|nr:PBP1A family penicillin-binding protein [Aerococcaceae bacterium DSM 111020]